MSINKLALIRYRTIDECLRNRYRKWTLDDLIQKVADTLYEMEGITSGVSKRTIQADIQLMRSDRLGYKAPIIVADRKFYTYADADYTIAHAPVTKADMEKMREVVGFLKHFNGFSYFEEMSEMISRLENNLYRSANPGRNAIQFESNHQAKGLQHINPLYQIIRSKRSLLVEYRSFKADRSQHYICFPYLLKEYRNRWFLIVRQKSQRTLSTLALDRIVEFQELTKEPYVEYDGVDLETYYDNLIGVTKNEKDKVHKVVLFITPQDAPYVLTKPLHHSQKLLERSERGTVISIEVVWNMELEREILGFGENIKVVAPQPLAGKIRKRLEAAGQEYQKPTKSR